MSETLEADGGTRTPDPIITRARCVTTSHPRTPMESGTAPAATGPESPATTPVDMPDAPRTPPGTIAVELVREGSPR